MDKHTNRLPVLFRIETSGQFKGEVTAYFPTEPGTRERDTLTCYSRIGQHSAAHVDWLRKGRPATPAEYAPLLAELIDIYRLGEAVHLIPVRRVSDKMHKERWAQTGAAV